MKRSLYAACCVAALCAPNTDGGGGATNLFGEAVDADVNPRDEFVILGGELIAEHLAPLRMRAEQTLNDSLTVTANTVERCCQSLLRHIVGLIPEDMVADAVADIRRAKDQQALDQEDQNTLHPADGTIHPDGTTVDPATGDLVLPTAGAAAVSDEPTAQDVKAAEPFAPVETASVTDAVSTADPLAQAGSVTSTSQPSSDTTSAAAGSTGSSDPSRLQAASQSSGALDTSQTLDPNASTSTSASASTGGAAASTGDAVQVGAAEANQTAVDAQAEADAKARADLLAGGEGG